MPRDPLAIVQRRLHSQRLASGHLSSPAEAVRWLGAVQAQEYAEAKWSIGERVEGCNDADVEDAVTRGEILRIHVLRPTWHFVTPEDLRWMLRLSAPRVHAANRYMYRKLDLPDATIESAHEIIARALGDERALTRPELQRALAQEGIEADGLRLGYILMHAELEALICSGPRRGRQHTYAAFEDRVPETPERSRDEALAELTLRFFRSRGPATVRDLSVWSGLTLTDARKGLDMVKDQVHTETENDTTWISEEPIGAAAPPTGAFPIPMYDEIGMGYRKDLRVVMAGTPPREGMLSRPIVIDGRTVGSWKRAISARAARIEATLFIDLTDEERTALDAVVERFGRFMQLPATLETAH